MAILNLDKVIPDPKVIKVTEEETGKVVEIVVGKVPMIYALKLNKLGKKSTDGDIVNIVAEVIEKQGKPAKSRDWLIANISNLQMIAIARYLFDRDEGNEPKKKTVKKT